MKRNTRVVLQLVIVAIFVVSGALGLVWLTKNKKPVAKKKIDIALPWVRVLTLKPASLPMTIKAQGTVTPARKSSLSTEVSGKIVFVSPALVEGGQFKKGQTLISVDPKNYEITKTLAKAKLKEAQTLVKTVREEAAVALEEWNRLSPNRRKTKPSALVVKEPQLEEAKAKLEAAKASLEQAELDLKRCKLNAPFDGIVEAKYADLGQYLNKGAKVADIFSTDLAEIVVPLEDDDLAWISVPHITPNSEPGSKAKVNAFFAGQENNWQGEVVRAQGRVDEKTRLVPVVVQVKKPYAKLPPLAPGVFANVEIYGHQLEKAFVIPRQAVHKGNTVWLVDKEGTLTFRKLDIARFEGNSAFVTNGFKKGEMLVTSHLKAVSNGMKVRYREINKEGTK